MPEEPIELIGPGGERSVGAADVVRHSSAGRVMAAAAYMVGGLLGGAACIIIPLLHLVTTWALPLLGVVLGLRAYKRRIVMYDLNGSCPVCHERIELVGGLADDPAWQTCPACQMRLTVHIAGDADARAVKAP